jgi:drug/metabolite transporter (DMT)-like permease
VHDHSFPGTRKDRFKEVGYAGRGEVHNHPVTFWGSGYNRPMRSNSAPSGIVVGLVLLVGILAASTAALFIRLAYAAEGSGSVGLGLLLATVRLSVASLVLLPAWWGIRKTSLKPGALRYAVLAGIFLGAHLALWITSLAYTSIAASATIVTTNPIWVALILWLWRSETPSHLTIAGIIVAFSGGTLIAVGDAGGASAGSKPLLGDLLALGGALTVSLYLIFGREAQYRGMGVGQYVATAYVVGAVTLLPTPLLLGSGYSGWPGEVYLYGLLLAFVPQLVGHTSFNWAVRWVSPTLVALVILAEPVGSSVLGYLVLGEVPGPLVLGGAAVLLIGVAGAVWGEGARSGTVRKPDGVPTGPD